MNDLPKVWKFSTLPDAALKELLKVRVLSDVQTYRESREDSSSDTLFALFEEVKPLEAHMEERYVTWCTDSYAATENGCKFFHEITTKHLRGNLIKSRVEKTQEEQKARVKAKAEVFTPAWVCNLQNNLVDEAILGYNAFNDVNEDNQKSWIPTISPIVFPEGFPWWKYVADRRLEMAAGEAPYLMNSYDATTGVYLPVRNEQGHFQRIGLLDRKLRVVTENVSSLEEWEEAAKIALKATFGYEWQGDNLLLARLNMVNTYFDYLVDFVAHVQGSKFTEEGFLKKRVTEIAAIASWQLWQMDGLKQVLPETCSMECIACKKKERMGHDGLLPVLKWGNKLLPFEDFLALRAH